MLTVPAMIGAGTAADDFTGVRFTAEGIQQPPDAPVVVADPAAAARGPVPMAVINGVELVIPAGQVELIGYHEASYDDALAMTPHGRLESNDNSTKFSPVADEVDGPAYTILSSRGRRHGATSAVDVVLAPGVNVLSPVSGVVTEVRPYLLYGRHQDVRIEIQPDGAPDLRVVLIHVRGVDIQAGDVVAAGVTVLAEEANLFRFTSQVDRYTEPNRFAHVHIEVKPPGGAVTD